MIIWDFLPSSAYTRGCIDEEWWLEWRIGSDEGFRQSKNAWLNTDPALQWIIKCLVHIKTEWWKGGVHLNKIIPVHILVAYSGDLLQPLVWKSFFFLLPYQVCTGAKSEQQSKLAARKVWLSYLRKISNVVWKKKSFHKEGK